MRLTVATCLGLLAVLAVPVFVLVNARSRGRGPSLLARPVPRRVWWITGFLLGGVVYLGRTWLDGGGIRGTDVTAAFRGLLVGLIALLISLVVLDLIRPRHSNVTRALRRARAGQVGAAINDLKRQGRSSRSAAALGDCYLLTEAWQEAYLRFLEAERLDGGQGRYLAKQAFALWKLGRGDEAMPLLDQATQLDQRNPSHAWTACLILADLGREQEAREQLERAERLVEIAIPPRSSRRRAHEESIALCRQRLASIARPEHSSETFPDPN